MNLDQRLYSAMGMHGVLALLAAVHAGWQDPGLAVWVFLAGLALRTLIAYKARG